MWSDFFGAVSWDFGILSIEIVNFVCYPLIFSHIFIIFLYFFIFFHIFYIFHIFAYFSYFFIFFPYLFKFCMLDQFDILRCHFSKSQLANQDWPFWTQMRGNTGCRIVYYSKQAIQTDIFIQYRTFCMDATVSYERRKI